MGGQGAQSAHAVHGLQVRPGRGQKAVDGGQHLGGGVLCDTFGVLFVFGCIMCVSDARG